MNKLAALSLTTLMLLPMPGSAQDQEDRRYRPPGDQVNAVVYRDRNFTGPAVAIQRDEPDLGLAWTVRSIDVKRGQWQICTGRNFSGKCTTVDRSIPDVANQFRRIVSMRPLGGGGGWNPGPNPPPRPIPNPSLRGMGAEFFPAPVQNGQRVLSCPNGGSTANCTARTADTFCRQSGWNGASYQSQQSEGRRVYLADVLCVRSGF